MELDRDMNSGTPERRVWKFKWMSLIFGCKYL